VALEGKSVPSHLLTDDEAAEVEAALNGTALPGSQPSDAAPPPEPGQRHVLAVAEVAALYGVDAKTVARWDKKGMVPASFRTPGGHRRFYEDEIMAQLNATRSRPPSP